MARSSAADVYMSEAQQYIVGAAAALLTSIACAQGAPSMLVK
jgi:hypothetical protein